MSNPISAFFGKPGKTCLPLLLGALGLTLACHAHAAGETVVRIGHAAPTSGMLKHLGQDNENGAILAIEELNRLGLKIEGRPVRFELITRDDAADPQKGAAVARELVAAKVVAVVGHLNSGTTIPAAAIYAQAGIPQISPSATNPKFTSLGYKTAFRLIANDASAASALGSWATQLPVEPSFVIIDDGSAYGQGVANTFANNVRQTGGEIRGRMNLGKSSSSMDTVITNLKNTTASWVFYGGMDEQAGPLFRQMRAAGVKMRMIGADGICTDRIVELIGGEALAYGDLVCLEPGGVPAGYWTEYRKFTERYTARFGKNVQIYAPYTYDAVHLLVEAMLAADSIVPEKFMPKLAQNSYRGLTGTLNFTEDGDLVTSSIMLYTYQYGKRKLISVYTSGK